MSDAIVCVRGQNRIILRLVSKSAAVYPLQIARRSGAATRRRNLIARRALIGSERIIFGRGSRSRLAQAREIESIEDQ